MFINLHLDSSEAAPADFAIADRWGSPAAGADGISAGPPIHPPASPQSQLPHVPPTSSVTAVTDTAQPAITDTRLASGHRRLIHACLPRALSYLGAFFVVAGVVAIAHGGVGLVVIGALMVVPSARVRFDRIQAQRKDHAETAALRSRLAAGQLLDPIEPSSLSAQGRRLGPNEMCFIDGVPVEVLSFYGKPFRETKSIFFAWGSPLAWVMSISAMLIFRGRNKKLQRDAAPQWRDPEPALLWVTSQRYILRGLTGNRSWVQIPFDVLRETAQENDGVVLTLPELPGQRIKLKVRNPTWHYELLRQLTDQMAV